LQNLENSSQYSFSTSADEEDSFSSPGVRTSTPTSTPSTHHFPRRIRNSFNPDHYHNQQYPEEHFPSYSGQYTAPSYTSMPYDPFATLLESNRKMMDLFKDMSSRLSKVEKNQK